MEKIQISTSGTKRIAYIDALRGFTMFLVVYWHIMALSFGIKADESVIGAFFLTFRMPTFFFLSGYLGFKAVESFSFSKWKELALKKTFVQLVPTAIFFSLFQIVNNSSPLIFFKNGLTGYWFTLVLFELFITYYTVNLVVNRLGGGKITIAVIFSLIALAGNIIALWINTRQTMPRISVVLTLNNFFYYFQFFVLGLFVKAFPQLKRLISDSRFFCITTTIFIALFIIQYKWITHDYNRYAYYLINSIFLKYAGLFMFYSMFSLFEDFFYRNGIVSRTMQFAGSRTLDIYLLHYFFLPSLLQYKEFFFPDGKESVLSEIVVISLLAITVMGICLLVSTCLRRSPIFAKYLFGILPKK